MGNGESKTGTAVHFRDVAVCGRARYLDLLCERLAGMGWTCARSYAALSGPVGVTPCIVMHDAQEMMPLLAASRTPRMGRWLIALSESCSPNQESEALDAGADDYIVVGSDLTTLSARLRRAGRRIAQVQTLQIGAIEISFASRTVRVDGDVVRLTQREYGLLELLATQPNSAIDRSRVLAHWECGGRGGSHILDVHLRNLRAKLGRARAQVVSINPGALVLRSEGV